MSLPRIGAIARAQATELARRRVSIAMLVTLPLLFYWTSGNDSYAPTFATVGAGWAFSILTLFLSLGMRSIAPRLELLGFTAADQLLGRLICVLGFGVLVAGGLWFYIGLDEVIVNHTHLATSFAFSLLGAVAIGLAVGAVLPKEMEAMLVLIAVVGLQFVVSQNSTLAKVLPLYAAERYSASASGWAPNIDSPWIPTVISSAVLLGVAIAATVNRSVRPR